MKAILLGLAAALIVAGQDVSGERMRAHVKFLASDLLEGRGVGTRGGNLATEYLASQLAVAGAKPGGVNGTYFQPLTLTGVATETSSQFAVSGGTTENFVFEKDFVGQTRTRQQEVKLDAELVFVGHGISAPEFNWNDYGSLDVKGKVVVLFTNEPPSANPGFFGGSALTYYGRWTYKYEEATRRGAAGVLIIHTASTAGYGWEVVRNSWGREESQAIETPLGFAGWLTQDAGERLLGMSGRKLDELLAAANKTGFQAFPLNARLTGTIRSAFRTIPTRNVLGFIPGSDPILANQVVVFTAHWDHLGLDPKAQGDGIYNGATDNATGCAVLLEMAAAWAKLEPRPKRSALFLFTTAEEQGLRGAEYWVAHPLIPLANTALVLNFDSYFPFGRSSDMVLLGAERTNFWPQIQQIAARLNLTVSPDPIPEQGMFFRSDHFPFAKENVGALSLKQGRKYLADSESRNARLAEHEAKHYHQPSDEYSDDWDFSGMEDVARFGFAVGQAAAGTVGRVIFLAN